MIPGSIMDSITPNHAEPAVPPRWLVPSAMLAALLLTGLVVRSLTLPEASRPRAITVRAEAINTGVSARTAAANEAVRAAWSALGDMMALQLPDGSKLTVPALGVEVRIVTFLSARAAPARASWFDFDRLLFDTGKATLQAPSAEQLANIAAILKAYPQVNILIAAHSGNATEAMANLHLSEARADSVMDELVKLGIDPARMSARGYGKRNPLGGTASGDGAQNDRDISLRLTGTPTSA